MLRDQPPYPSITQRDEERDAEGVPTQSTVQLRPQSLTSGGAKELVIATLQVGLCIEYDEPPIANDNTA
eukprot:CAMPEP_0174735806 /NCGR_PEP_ID=MMETSP1094-20130205/65580_1 /TAXON_ID=156173 /ORGANISM="Chrysochromulina brevifilum, Strain UTEX LB 985" /LENGTH=68 /DNA_ID=CAMNT_0015938809 /DNA_START=340 /DNA_END=543 /DNA_ORIENTATION=+